MSNGTEYVDFKALFWIDLPLKETRNVLRGKISGLVETTSHIKQYTG